MAPWHLTPTLYVTLCHLSVVSSVTDSTPSASDSHLNHQQKPKALGQRQHESSVHLQRSLAECRSCHIMHPSTGSSKRQMPTGYNLASDYYSTSRPICLRQIDADGNANFFPSASSNVNSRLVSNTFHLKLQNELNNFKASSGRKFKGSKSQRKKKKKKNKIRVLKKTKI